MNGEPRTIRRTAKPNAQTYAVSVGKEPIEAAERTHIAYTYRALVSIDDHLLQLRVNQPTEGLSVELDYTDTALEPVSVLDFITSSRRSRIVRTKPELPARAVGVEFDGWVFHAAAWRSSGTRKLLMCGLAAVEKMHLSVAASPERVREAYDSAR